jgi:hypothetical protein
MKFLLPAEQQFRTLDDPIIFGVTWKRSRGRNDLAATARTLASSSRKDANYY